MDLFDVLGTEPSKSVPLADVTGAGELRPSQVLQGPKTIEELAFGWSNPFIGVSFPILSGDPNLSRGPPKALGKWIWFF